MQFGYFTLSDNRYPGNTRSAEDFIKDIFAEALYAEKVGLNSAWIGEHHFNLLGVNASPLAMLAQLAGATTKLRLAPAVTLLPVHHPLHVAEEWATLDLLSGGRVDFAAGRGYDRKEYEPFQAPFDDSAELFAEGLEIVWRAWTEPGKWSHKGKFYEFKDVEIRPRPAQKPLRPYVACFSRPSMELAAKNDWNVIYAPFAAAMVYGSLADAVRVYRETCEQQFKRPMRRAMCSYFVHIASTPEEEQYGKEALVRYFQDALIAAFPVVVGREGAADLQILRRDREHPARHAAGEADRQVDPVRQPAAHRRHPEDGRGGRRRRGDPLFQLRPEAARAGEGADGPLHARGRAALLKSGGAYSVCCNYRLFCRAGDAARAAAVA